MRKTTEHHDVIAMIESRMTQASIRRSNVKAARLLLGYRLAEFRRSLRRRQSSVKGFPQPAISRIEGRNDIKVSTLVEYCRGLGAELTITARPLREGKNEGFVLLHSE